MRYELPNKADQWIDYFRHADSRGLVVGLLKRQNRKQFCTSKLSTDGSQLLGHVAATVRRA
jgi:hypothetical protein